jgi:hypothetical protein
MRQRRLLLVLISVVAWALAPVAAASAVDGCNAPQDTAAVDQYCESLPTADGTTDVSQPPARPLAAVLRDTTVKKLQKAGPLGQAVLALPAPVDAMRPGSRAARARHRALEPKLDGLLPGPGTTNASSVVTASVDGGGNLDGGLGWVLVLTLLGLSAISLWGSVFRVSAR